MPKYAVTSRTNIALLALLALVVQNTSLVVFLKLSFRAEAQPYDPATVVLTVECVKLVVCSLAVLRQSADQLVDAFFQIPRQKMLVIPSLLYVVQNNLLFFGAQRLSPIAYIVCSQMKILTTAVISRFLLGTELSMVQHLALLFLVFGIVTVQGHGADVRFPSAEQNDEGVVGVAAVLLASFTSGLAGVMLENLFKIGSHAATGTEISVWTRNIQLCCVSLPFAFAGTRFRVSTVKFFRGYDAVVMCVVLLQAFGGILTGYVLKYANNILKCLAIAISICCCAAYSVARGEQVMTGSLVFGVIVVNAAVCVFSLCPKKNVRMAAAEEHKVIGEERVGVKCETI